MMIWYDSMGISKLIFKKDSLEKRRTGSPERGKAKLNGINLSPCFVDCIVDLFVLQIIMWSVQIAG
jgi:hypothetical protein